MKLHRLPNELLGQNVVDLLDSTQSTSALLSAARTKVEGRCPEQPLDGRKNATNVSGGIGVLQSASNKSQQLTFGSIRRATRWAQAKAILKPSSSGGASASTVPSYSQRQWSFDSLYAAAKAGQLEITGLHRREAKACQWHPTVL